MLLNKVISASAGTGKTYRLSLEFINILLCCRKQEINFREICIVTFTRKATAEIRNRIYEHLEELVSGSEKGKALSATFTGIFGYSITDEDITFFKGVRQQILLHKNQLQISTIDSLLFNIFKSHVAPFLGITEPVIDDNATDDILPKLYEFMLSKDNLSIIRTLFEQSRNKTIETYRDFLVKLIDQRWFFHYVEQQESGMQTDTQEMFKAWETIAEAKWIEYSTRMIAIVTEWWRFIHAKYPGELISKLLNKEYREQWLDGRDGSNFDIPAFIRDYFKEPTRVERKNSLWLGCSSFWNNTKFNSKKEPFAAELEERCADAAGIFGEYLFHKRFLLEQYAIKQFSRKLFKYYDELRFQTRIFTYSDIAYYTYKYLYDPELSLVDMDYGYVNNRFYELLTNRIRFLLIDEFQDTSILQFQILLPIIRELISGETAKPYGGVIVVGDEKQSIYRWRGGERDLLINMKKVLTHCDEEYLNISFRSYQPVMNFINTVFLHENMILNLAAHGIDWDYKLVQPEPKHREMIGGVKVRFRNLTEDKENTVSNDESAIREFVEDMVIPLIDPRNNQLSMNETVILTRRNIDLKNIAAVLTENGIDYIWESTYSILHHRSVKPLMYLLRFTLRKRWLDLLKFLRSDAVLLDADTLKRILVIIRNSEKEKLTSKLLAFPEIAKVFEVMESFRQENLLDYCSKIIRAYHFTEIWQYDNDIKNLHRFLDIVADFEQQKADEPLTLHGFMTFCKELEKNKSMGQIGMQTKEGLTLLSIHRAKGLQFNNVFFYTKAEGARGGTSTDLKIYMELKRPMFSRLEQYAYTCNYDGVIPNTKLTTMAENNTKQQAIEELNSIYVALTRAALNLIVYVAYKNKDGIAAATEKITTTKEDISIPKLLLQVLYHTVSGNGWVQDIQKFTLEALYGTLQDKALSEAMKKNVMNVDFNDYIETDRSKYAIEKKNLQDYLKSDLKQSYLVNKSNMIGNATHFMMSFLSYGEENEFTMAISKTTELYGHYLNPAELEKVKTSVRDFVKAESSLFDKTKWNKVFTEFTIFGKYQEAYHLDRLLIDEKNKLILIIDYKSGHTPDKKQIDNYITLVQDLSIVKDQGYSVDAKYVTV